MKFSWSKFFKKEAAKLPSTKAAEKDPMDTSPKMKLDKCWQIALGLKDDYITEDQLEKVIAVRLFEPSGEHKTDTLDPIFAMPNLHKLTLTGSYRQPVDFSLLCRLGRLRDLKIPMCNVTRLDALEAMDFLRILDISNIKLKTDQLKPIDDFPKLKYLSVAGTGLRSMKIFQNNTNIERLIGSYSKGIKGMTNLSSLFLLLRDQVDIVDCPNLRYLRISRPRKMIAVDNLANLTSLKKLELIMLEKPMNIAGLSKLTNLEDLFLDRLMDLSSLSEPMESVLYLRVLRKDRTHFESIEPQLKTLFPNAKLAAYEQFVRFLDLE